VDRRGGRGRIFDARRALRRPIEPAAGERDGGGERRRDPADRAGSSLLRRGDLRLYVIGRRGVAELEMIGEAIEQLRRPLFEPRCDMPVAILCRHMGDRAGEERLSVRFGEDQSLHALHLRRIVGADGLHQPPRRVDLAKFAAQPMHLALRPAQREAPPSPDAQIDLAFADAKAVRLEPALDVLRSRKRLEHALARRVEDPLQRNDGFVRPYRDLRFLAHAPLSHSAESAGDVLRRPLRAQASRRPHPRDAREDRDAGKPDPGRSALDHAARRRLFAEKTPR
jgi:hypothetical protein